MDVNVERQGAVTVVTLARPDVRNAVDSATARALPISIFYKDGTALAFDHDRGALVFFWDDSCLYAQSISGGKCTLKRLNVTSDFKTAIEQWNPGNLQSNPKDMEETLAILSDYLMPLIQTLLTNSDLLIEPDGPLCFLPFEALSFKQNGVSKYLIEDHTITYTFSLEQASKTSDSNHFSGTVLGISPFSK